MSGRDTCATRGAILTSDQEQKQPGDESGDETDEQLCAAIDQLLDPEAKAALRKPNSDDILGRLALNYAHLILDTRDAIRKKQLALWRARFEWTSKKPRKPEQSGWKLVRKLTPRELDAEQRELHTLQLALPDQEKSARALQTETLHRAIAQFVAVAKKQAKYASDHDNPFIRGEPWPVKKIVKEAMRIFGVNRRTIFYAINHFPEDHHFTYTDGSKPVPSAVE
jgi:hypothetical protein